MFTFNQKYSIMQEKKSKTLPIHLNDESDEEFLMKKLDENLSNLTPL